VKDVPAIRSLGEGLLGFCEAKIPFTSYTCTMELETRARERAKSSLTEDLFGQMILSIFLKNWHFDSYQRLELARRLGGITAASISGMSRATIDASRGVGRVAMSGIK
jgi:hypothetical protein